MPPERSRGLLRHAREVLRVEARAVSRAAARLGRGLEEAARLLAGRTGRVAVIGIGKSGLIGRKLAATLASTGTPALFLHPVESLHGDLGMLAEGDVILALSYSGRTEEIKRLLPFIRSKGLKIVAMTGKAASPLAREADKLIHVPVEREACPYNITPTASTTAMLAVGDALAMVLMRLKRFKAEDFARLHPAGSLGRRLNLRVKDLMHSDGEQPTIGADKTVKQALAVMTRTRLGSTCVVDAKGRLVGFFTDGDLRRGLQRDPRLLSRRLREVMTQNPVCAHPEQPAFEAAKLLQRHGVDNLPVLDPKTRRPLGVLDEKDLLDAGLA